MLEDRPRRAARLGRLDLAEASSWFEPNFGATWPSCVADAEEIARFFLTAMAARGGSRGDPEAPGGRGDLVDILTQTHVMRFRVPGAAAQPGQGGSPVESALMKDPLLTWLLFPSTGASTNGRFWRDSAYGRFVSTLEKIAPEEGIPQRVATGSGQDLLFTDLPPAWSRAVADLAAPLIEEWLQEGKVEDGTGAPPNDTKERNAHG